MAFRRLLPLIGQRQVGKFRSLSRQNIEATDQWGAFYPVLFKCGCEGSDVTFQALRVPSRQELLPMFQYPGYRPAFRPACKSLEPAHQLVNWQEWTGTTLGSVSLVVAGRLRHRVFLGQKYGLTMRRLGKRPQNEGPCKPPRTPGRLSAHEMFIDQPPQGVVGGPPGPM